MRNLLEYPITADEAVAALQIALEGHTRNVATHGIGGTDGISLIIAERFIAENKGIFNSFSSEFLKHG